MYTNASGFYDRYSFNNSRYRKGLCDLFKKKFGLDFALPQYRVIDLLRGGCILTLT